MGIELCYFSGGARERVFQAIIRNGHVISRVFVNDPNRWPKVKKTIDLANSLSIPVTIIYKKSEISNIIETVRGKNCISAGFNYLFTSEFLGVVDVCINVHGSLLPKYPGARTLSWAIVNGETESGVTVHKVDEGMDTGPILLQRMFKLSPFETTRSLGRKTGDFEPQVVVDALARFEALGLAAFVQQSGSSEPVLENRTPAHSEIDPNLPLACLVDQIRAADPDHYPAFFMLHGQKVCVRLWRPDKPSDETDLL